MKRLAFVLGTALLSAVFLLTLWQDMNREWTGYQRQFEQPLQPGVECTVRERRGTWWNIELVDGNTGWIQAGDAELISEEREALSQVLRP